LIFSIVIPTFRRPKQLRDCLDSVARLDYPHDVFEVLVVDDGSDAPPEGVVSAFHGQLNIRLLNAEHGGPAAARNRGAAEAKGAYLAFTDDDCAPSPDWLRALAKHVAEVPKCLIGGQTINALADNPYSNASQTLTDYLYDYFAGATGYFFTSNNLCVSAELFRAMGGFDTSFPFSDEDREFSDRWFQLGHRLVYAADAIVYHAHFLTFSSFCRQHFNYGRGAPHFRDVRTKRNGKELRVDPVKFYLKMLRYSFQRARNNRALLTSILLALSQAAYAAGVTWEVVSSIL
jgi:GT2 family glycosyltransferase